MRRGRGKRVAPANIAMRGQGGCASRKHSAGSNVAPLPVESAQSLFSHGCSRMGAVQECAASRVYSHVGCSFLRCLEKEEIARPNPLPLYSLPETVLVARSSRKGHSITAKHPAGEPRAVETLLRGCSSGKVRSAQLRARSVYDCRTFAVHGGFPSMSPAASASGDRTGKHRCGEEHSERLCVSPSDQLGSHAGFPHEMCPEKGFRF